MASSRELPRKHTVVSTEGRTGIQNNRATTKHFTNENSNTTFLLGKQTFFFLENSPRT